VISRLLGTALKLALALAVILAALGGILVLRLESGPLPLDFLTPMLEASLSPPGGAFRVRIAGTVLSLSPDHRRLELLTRGVRLAGSGGRVLATIPEFVLGLSVEALLRGMLAPVRIVVEGARIHLERDADGAFRLGIGGDTPGDAGLMAQLVQDFLAPPYAGHPLGYLKEIAVRDASLTVADRMLGARWQAPHASGSLARRPDGIAGGFALAVAVAGSTAELDGAFRYRRGAHRLTTDFTLAGWDFSRLAGLAPVLAPLAGLEAPVGGTVQVSLDTAAGRVSGASAALTLGAGAIVAPRLESGRAPLAGGAVDAGSDPVAQRLTLRRLALDLGGPRIAASGTLDGLDATRLLRDPADWGGPLAVAIEIAATAMPADALATFWPSALAPHARDWITANIHDGAVDEAHLSARLRLDPAAPPAEMAAVETLGGTLAMHGLTIDYLRPLPPVRGVAGTAVFDQSRMTLTPTAGDLDGVAVQGGTIVITDLDKKDQDIDIALDVKGRLKGALEVLDSKPFRYAHELGIDPAAVAGGLSAHLAFKFPLDHRTTFDQVAVTARAHLTDAAVGKLVLGQDLTRGDLRLDLDRTGMRLDGTADLAGAPAKVGWQQSFGAKKAGVRSRFTLSTRLDDALRRRLGFDLAAVAVTGPVGLEASLTRAGDGTGEAVLALDGNGAAIAIPDLAWTKPAGQPTTAKLTLALAGDRLAAIREARVTGRGVDLDLAAAFGTGDGALQRVNLKRFVLGQTDLSGTVARRPEGGWRADLHGPSLDATGILAELKTPGASTNEPPLVFNGTFGRLVLGPGREARQVVLQLYSDGAHWQSVALDAAPFGKGAVKLRFGETGGARPFTFTTSDLGATLRLLGISTHVAGGHLSASGTASDTGGTRRFAGHVEGGDYRILNAPVMAKLLSLASFSSIASLLSGDGIPFSRLTADFTAADGKVSLSHARAWGGALGVNLDGTVDLDRDALDLTGTIVPAYALNSILGNIPVIGNLLQGGEGQGLFAANFRAAGPLADPTITVNPLSALAPGFLRNLFLFDAPSAAPAPKPEGAK
jgi:hypothetical protein